ncbi:MAG: HIT family protein [Candidatus Paceibacterota bacterium]|jgi:histidine triad (HIT) family protein
MDCIFCKIIRGEIPCEKVYEDEFVLSFLDINPVMPGHTLVITKEHHANILEVAEGTLERLATRVQKVARGVKDGTLADGIFVSTLSGEAAGQSVFHIHFHIIPRYENDGLVNWPYKPYAPGEREEVAKKIKTALSS